MDSYYPFYKKLHNTSITDFRKILKDVFSTKISNLYLARIRDLNNADVSPGFVISFFVITMHDAHRCAFYNNLQKQYMSTQCYDAGLYFLKMQQYLYQPRNMQQELLHILPKVLINIVDEYINKYYIDIYPTLNATEKRLMLKWYHTITSSNLIL